MATITVSVPKGNLIARSARVQRDKIRLTGIYDDEESGLNILHDITIPFRI